MKNSIIVSLFVVTAITPMLTGAIIAVLYRNTIYATSGESKQNAFEAYVQHLVREQPTAPRVVRFGELVNAGLKKSDMQFIVGLMMLFSLVALFVLWKDWGKMVQGDSNALFVAILFGSLSLLLFVAILRGFQLRKQLLQDGTLVDAKVLDVQYASAVKSMQKTLAAGKYGMAQGHVEIPMGGKVVQKPFEIDQSWAQFIQTGSTMQVLIDPTNKNKIIFFIGLKE